MEMAIRPYVSTGVVLAAAGLVAVAPVTAPLPGVQMADIQLTAGEDNAVADALQGLFLQQLHSNTTLIENDVAANGGLVDGVHGLSSIGAWLPGGAENPGLANDAVAHMVQGFFQLIGAGEASSLGSLGVRGTLEGTDQWATFTPFDPAALYGSLLLTGGHAVNLEDIPGAAAMQNYGGLQGAVGQFLVFGSELGNLAGRDFVGQDLFDSLVNHADIFNADVFAAESSFNSDLLASELAMEQALFGNDSAINGVINRAFNMFNMGFDAQQQSMNGFLGLGYDTQAQTQGLLLGSYEQEFNGGEIGGYQGMFDQGLALLANIAGMSSADWKDLFSADFASEAFQAAFKDFGQVLAGGAFGDAFDMGDTGALHGVFTDLSAIWDAMWAVG